MISALITILVLNALCAVPMALCVRRDFARLGRVSSPIAIWSGITMYLYGTVTFVLAWLDRGSLSEPSPTSLALGLVMATVGGSLIVAGRREYASRSRVYGLLEDKMITEGIYRYSRNPQYLGFWLLLLAAAIASLSQLAVLPALGFAVIIHCCITRVEEPHLRSAFEEQYVCYYARTARYLRIKR